MRVAAGRQIRHKEFIGMNDALYNKILATKDQVLAELAEGKSPYGSFSIDDVATVDGTPCVVTFYLLPRGVRGSDQIFEIDFEARHLNDNSIDYFAFYDSDKPSGFSWKTGGEVRSRVPEEIRLLGLESRQLHAIELHFKSQEEGFPEERVN
jgi:hypothetical protein